MRAFGTTPHPGVGPSSHHPGRHPHRSRCTAGPVELCPSPVRSPADQRVRRHRTISQLVVDGPRPLPQPEGRGTAEWACKAVPQSRRRSGPCKHARPVGAVASASGIPARSESYASASRPRPPQAASSSLPVHSEHCQQRPECGIRAPRTLTLGVGLSENSVNRTCNKSPQRTSAIPRCCHCRPS